jgi:PTS system nitrogen regulatory IIA component
MDNGVALLHPRRPLPDAAGEPVLAVGISPQGIPFGGSRRLTDVFFLICSTDERGHLRTLARLSRLIGREDFLTKLRQAASPAEIRAIVIEAEAGLSE